MFGFSVKIANVSVRKYFYVLVIKIAMFHPNGCASNTPILLQPNASSPQNYTPVSAKFRYTSTVSLQTADTTTVKTTCRGKNCNKSALILLVVKTVIVSVEGKDLFGFLQ